MQTLVVPWRMEGEASDVAHRWLDDLRRIQSAAIRTAYANATGTDGKSLPEKDLRQLVKARFPNTLCDAWLLHSATLEGKAQRKARPDGKAIFGGRKALLRRAKGLISAEEWKRQRLLPLVSFGDKTLKGNRHFRLSPCGRFCDVSVYGRSARLNLSNLRGKHGQLLRQVAEDAAAKRINLMFRLGDKSLCITFDPEALSAHPDRKAPVQPVAGRVLGLDLNPYRVGVSVAQLRPERHDFGDEVEVLHWELQDLSRLHARAREDRTPGAAQRRTDKLRNELALLARRTVNLARHWRAEAIALEDLRSIPKGDAGKGKRFNRMVSGLWARRQLAAFIGRYAAMAGIKLVVVPAAYSSFVGNLRHALPDAAAAATEIARRGFYAARGVRFDMLDMSNVFWPTFRGECLPRQWKDEAALVTARGWLELYGAWKKLVAAVQPRRPRKQARGPAPGPAKAAQTPASHLRVRRGHPVVATRHVVPHGFMARQSGVLLWSARQELSPRASLVQRAST